jgi:hypothetical protein
MCFPELEGACVGLVDEFRISASEAVSPVGDQDQFVRQIALGERAGHRDRLFRRPVRIGAIGLAEFGRRFLPASK